MAVVRENSGGHDRSAEDRLRHRHLVEESIKKNIGHIIAEESIIGQSRDKKIKIPIRGLKEYQFIFGQNKPSVGSGTGEEKRGQRLSAQQVAGSGQAGSEAGEDIYETEVTLEELINYLFEDLQLPNLERKKMAEIISEHSAKRWGLQRRGIPPRLAKKRTVMEKVKRRQAYRLSQKNLAGDAAPEERFPFSLDDLRYQRVKTDIRRDSNAVVICVMDTSGSMDQTKKYLARSFYFLLYQFVRMRYSHVEVVFIAHTTVAKEVTEDEFFHRGESGGTFISSGYAKALEIIETRYNPATWNIYTFHCSDGDNWAEDNKRAVELAQRLCQVSNLFGFGETDPGMFGSTIKNLLKENLKFPNFAVVTLAQKEDIWPAFKRMLEWTKGGATV